MHRLAQQEHPENRVPTHGIGWSGGPADFIQPSTNSDLELYVNRYSVCSIAVNRAKVYVYRCYA